MAFNLGKSSDDIKATGYRTDHGPFNIPFPSGTTLEQRPFGLLLSNNKQLDLSRIHIRIAAIQARLTVAVERGGEIEPPVGNGTELQRDIFLISKKLDHMWFVHHRHDKQRGADRPVGFYPDLWKDAATIQERIIRQRRVPGRPPVRPAVQHGHPSPEGDPKFEDFLTEKVIDEWSKEPERESTGLKRKGDAIESGYAKRVSDGGGKRPLITPPTTTSSQNVEPGSPAGGGRRHIYDANFGDDIDEEQLYDIMDQVLEELNLEKELEEREERERKEHEERQERQEREQKEHEERQEREQKEREERQERARQRDLEAKRERERVLEVQLEIERKRQLVEWEVFPLCEPTNG